MNARFNDNSCPVGLGGAKLFPGMYPFERFNNIAKQTLHLAQKEAEEARLGYIGTEHLLLGLLAQPDSLAGRAMSRLGVEFDQVRVKIRGSWSSERVGPLGPQVTIPRSRVKQVIAFAFEEATRSGARHVDTAHLLVGVLTDGYGVAADALVGMGATLEKVRASMASVISEGHVGEDRD